MTRRPGSRRRGLGPRFPLVAGKTENPPRQDGLFQQQGDGVPEPVAAKDGERSHQGAAGQDPGTRGTKQAAHKRAHGPQVVVQGGYREGCARGGGGAQQVWFTSILFPMIAPLHPSLPFPPTPRSRLSSSFPSSPFPLHPDWFCSMPVMYGGSWGKLDAILRVHYSVDAASDHDG